MYVTTLLCPESSSQKLKATLSQPLPQVANGDGVEVQSSAVTHTAAPPSPAATAAPTPAPTRVLTPTPATHLTPTEEPSPHPLQQPATSTTETPVSVHVVSPHEGFRYRSGKRLCLFLKAVTVCDICESQLKLKLLIHENNPNPTINPSVQNIPDMLMLFFCYLLFFFFFVLNMLIIICAGFPCAPRTESTKHRGAAAQNHKRRPRREAAQVSGA